MLKIALAKQLPASSPKCSPPRSWMHRSVSMCHSKSRFKSRHWRAKVSHDMERKLRETFLGVFICGGEGPAGLRARRAGDHAGLVPGVCGDPQVDTKNGIENTRISIFYLHNRMNGINVLFLFECRINLWILTFKLELQPSIGSQSR